MYSVHVKLISLCCSGRIHYYFSLLIQLNLDKVWTVIFGIPANKPVSLTTKEKQADLCPEAAIVILSMIRSMLNQVRKIEVPLNTGIAWISLSMYLKPLLY